MSISLSRGFSCRRLAQLTGDEFPDAADQIDSSLANIEEEVDDAAEEVEDSCNYSVDERGKGADNAGKELVDGLEEVLEGGNEFGHLDCGVVCGVSCLGLRMLSVECKQVVCLNFDVL